MNAETPLDTAARVVAVHQAKTHLSRLLAEVEAGAEIVLARGKTPVARLVPLNPAPPKSRQLGWLRGDSKGSDPLAYGFWDPLPDDELELWNGESLPTDPLYKPPDE
ncbi:MAG TPA: antitoxin [Allosphingosinicella sp.]|jgi:antitoxin (DNA-binding transcriptional repressor) of toxin-antitoxin stability system|uniref:type II toxin-antitoxin system Phd/YefM family antitoxin n=1 Tax=Allosphingosinicella sp. TaxID=2823234 RepID=UPI002F277F56